MHRIREAYVPSLHTISERTEEDPHADVRRTVALGDNAENVVKASDTTKYITIDLTKTKTNAKKIAPKPADTLTTNSEKKSRVITDTNSWIKHVTDRKINLYDSQVQWMCFSNPTDFPIVEKQIYSKIRGYKAQDMDKGIYQEELFVNYPYVVSLIRDSSMCCFYCQKPTMILYEEVREPKQWTLERIDNSSGHNRGNVQIACLTCNLRRRTMFQERYLLTKQMMYIRKIDDQGGYRSL